MKCLTQYFLSEIIRTLTVSMCGYCAFHVTRLPVRSVSTCPWLPLSQRGHWPTDVRTFLCVKWSWLQYLSKLLLHFPRNHTQNCPFRCRFFLSIWIYHHRTFQFSSLRLHLSLDGLNVLFFKTWKHRPSTELSELQKKTKQGWESSLHGKILVGMDKNSW